MKPTARICTVLLHLLWVGANDCSDVFDHVKNVPVGADERWMEVGYFSISPHQWTTVQVTYTNFKDPVVFISLPVLPGESADSGQSMSLRVNDTRLATIDEGTSYYQFQARSFNVNNSFCTELESFYTPSELALSATTVAWLVVEKGMFNISGKRFIIHSDSINRTDSDVRDNKANQFRSLAPSGVCNGQRCMIDIPESEWDTLLSIAQIQTTRYDRFLLLRGLDRGADFVVYVLQPHDSAEEAGYFNPNPGENYAWMLFESDLSIACTEGLALETHSFSVISVSNSISYASVFIGPPAVFGMINTIVGRDSTAIRQSSVSSTAASLIAQEDKCLKEETNHFSSEGVSLLIIGQSEGGSAACSITIDGNSPTPVPSYLPSADPTAVPTARPIFQPTGEPTAEPTGDPSAEPTSMPTGEPTVNPSYTPTVTPTIQPTGAPSAIPTAHPTIAPTLAPSPRPTAHPTPKPTGQPTRVPSPKPSTACPSATPSLSPTRRPTRKPTFRPTTFVANEITIDARTTLVGASCSDSEALQVFQNSVAVTLGIAGEGVVITACSDATRRKLKGNDLRSDRKLVENTIDISFGISFVIEEFGYASPDDAFEGTDDILSSSLEDGSFDNMLMEGGVNVTTAGLNLNSYTVVAIRTDAPSPSPSSSDSSNENSFFGGPLYYLSLAVAGGVILCFGSLACYFYLFRPEEVTKPVMKSKPFQYTTASSTDMMETGNVEMSFVSPTGPREVEEVVIFLAEHRKLNSELRVVLEQEARKDPALLLFILGAYEPARLSKDHKKYLKEYLKKISDENKSLWTLAVRVGAKKEIEKPAFLNVEVGVVVPLSKSPKSNMAAHFSMSAHNKPMNAALSQRFHVVNPELEERENYSTGDHRFSLLSDAQSSQIFSDDSQLLECDDDEPEENSNEVSSNQDLEMPIYIPSPKHPSPVLWTTSRRVQRPVSLLSANLASEPSGMGRSRSLTDLQANSVASPPIVAPMKAPKLTKANLSALPKSELRRSSSLHDIVAAAKVSKGLMTPPRSSPNETKRTRSAEIVLDPTSSSPTESPPMFTGGTTGRRKGGDLAAFRRVGHGDRSRRKKYKTTGSMGNIAAAESEARDDKFDPYSLWGVPRTSRWQGPTMPLGKNFRTTAVAAGSRPLSLPNPPRHVLAPVALSGISESEEDASLEMSH